MSGPRVVTRAGQRLNRAMDVFPAVVPQQRYSNLHNNGGAAQWAQQLVLFVSQV